MPMIATIIIIIITIAYLWHYSLFLVLSSPPKFFSSKP